MSLRNRVTPFGDIVAAPERGTMFGNRGGILHDEHKKIVRTSQVRRWLSCVLEFQGIRRTLMKPRSYTALFFPDEATAFAAGHRPCFECRRQDALNFQVCWAKAFGVTAKADEMDRVLSSERRHRGGQQRTCMADLACLPTGTFVALDGTAWLLLDGQLQSWIGWRVFRCAARRASGAVRKVLTPRDDCRAAISGYTPKVHASAGE